jgi:subtilisin-like proprotein convertase family protein
MKRLILLLVVVVLAVAAPSLIPILSPQAATQDDRHKEGQVQDVPARAAYKSSSGRHKIQISDPNVVEMLKSRKVKTIGEYDSFTLVEVDTETAEELTGKKQGEWRDDYNVIMLNAHPIDTTSDNAVKMQEAGGADSTGRRLHLVHFPGPIQPEGYDALIKMGVEIVTYIPNNAYLVYGDRASLRRVRNAARANGLLQWEAPYVEAMKVDPSVGLQLEREKASQDGVLTAQESKPPKGELPSTNLYAIQLFKSSDNKATLDLINEVKTDEIRSDFEILKYRNIIVAVPANETKRIAGQPDVVSIQPYILPKKRDERQNQIMAGNITGNLPNAADYLAYLAGKGFTQAQFTTSGFAVDVSDDGLENGTVNIDHPNLRVGGIAAGATRVVYNRLETSGGATTPGRTGFEGHGNLNTHVIGGFVNFAFGSGFPHADAAGFRFGLGIAPFVRVGQSAIFNPGFTSPNFGNLQARAYNDGARISSNSWGASVGGAYTVDAQAYDALVRDAQPATSVFPTVGNQEMVILFAAGNDGSGANTVGAPGTAKNVITVGAAENVHSHSTANGGNNAAGNDGCGIADTGADSANDIIFFSSRGPCDDGRNKPDIVGPGTHVTGGVAQAPAPGVNGGALATFNALGVCALPGSGTAGDPDNFFPLAQQWYTTSSGTSHSTPAVAGAAALVRQHFINLALSPPSPAMTKGILMNSARYMNGVGANDNLWSNNQGLGEANFNSFFDIFATTNILRDQLPADTFTASGQSRVFTGNVVDNTRPFRVTLAWTDTPGPTSGNAFVNNLDLEVTVGGQTFKGNVFVGGNSATGGTADPRNNVESVFVPAGVTGPFVVRVLATNIAGDGVPNSGGALDQDFALIVPNGVAVAQAVVASAGATIVTESCSPATGTIDPAETVTVSFCLQNVGTLNTTNLVATLQPTGGVTSPSGPQTYGVLVAGGPAVCRNFTFTASGACGDTLTATLQLQDGATNLGTVTFTFTLGSLSSPTTASYSSGNIAVPIPDQGSVDVPLSVPDVGVVSDVNARVRLNHTFDGDLVISLVHPDGTVLPLSTNRGGSGQNYGTGGNDCSGTHTVFDDAAAAPISAGVAPFAGTFRPESPLSAFNGKASNGTWILRVADTAALDVGTIGCFQLEIGRSVFLCCPFTGGMANIIAVPPAVLTAESCSPANGAVDPDETVTMDFPLQNIGTGSTTNLVATLQATGGVTAPSGPQNYGSVPPVGGPVSRPFTFTAVGTCGGTITATLQLQDGATNLGTVTFTISLGATVNTTTTFSNPAPILIPGTGTSGPAAPYPSTIAVSGITGAVNKVTATLNLFNHTFPDDVDVLLVGPGGQKLLLMSDVGGSADAINVTVTFDDAASGTIPDAGPVVSGTFRPSNIGTGDTFPAPAPVGPYPDPQLLSVFNGVNANGTWSLFVVDDVGGDVGNFNGGWSLNITESTPVCCVSACTITCPANTTVSNDPNQCGAVVNYPPPTASAGCGTVTCSPASGSFFPVGTTTVTCTGTGGNCSFTVTVADTQPPAITCPANVTAVTSQTSCVSSNCAVTNFTTTASDNCPGVTVACVPPSGSCFPLGTTTVTCTATDASGNTATCSFTVTTFDVCVQDDSNPATKLVFNSTTGEFRFCCGGTLYTGTGVVAKQGCTVTLTHNSGSLRVTARVVKSAFSGTASLQSPPGTQKCTISDKDIRNNVCVCP